jgi:hypothetical protein
MRADGLRLSNFRQSCHPIVTGLELVGLDGRLGWRHDVMGKEMKLGNMLV